MCKYNWCKIKLTSQGNFNFWNKKILYKFQPFPNIKGKKPIIREYHNANKIFDNRTTKYFCSHVDHIIAFTELKDPSNFQIWDSRAALLMIIVKYVIFVGSKKQTRKCDR